MDGRVGMLVISWLCKITSSRKFLKWIYMIIFNRNKSSSVSKPIYGRERKTLGLILPSFFVSEDYNNKV